ncbi:2-oxoacid:acceptor oxidoreductase subunit alpha, partial [Candidatus Bathyarchaeota archaeon]
TGSTHDEYGIRYTADPEVHRRLVQRLVHKITGNADKIIDVEAHNIENCEVGVVSFGCTSRSVYEAVEMAREEGIKVGQVRLRTIWPFPEKIVKAMARNAKAIIVPEMNLKQIFYEVDRTVKGLARVVSINKVGGGELITPEEVLSEIRRWRG